MEENNNQPKQKEFIMGKMMTSEERDRQLKAVAQEVGKFYQR